MYWPKMWMDVENYVKNCFTCIRRKASAKEEYPLKPLPIPTSTWNIISVDLLKLPMTITGY